MLNDDTFLYYLQNANQKLSNRLNSKISGMGRKHNNEQIIVDEVCLIILKLCDNLFHFANIIYFPDYTFLKFPVKGSWHLSLLWKCLLPLTQHFFYNLGFVYRHHWLCSCMLTFGLHWLPLFEIFVFWLCMMNVNTQIIHILPPMA